MKIKKNDFLIVNFLGRIKDGDIFDASFPEEAKEVGIKEPKPMKVIVGQGMAVKGLDESFLDKEEGEEYTVDVPPEKGFGKRNADLIKLMPAREFKKQKINPYPGLQFAIDGTPARVLTVSSGRVTVDLNFPLAGKDLEYKIKIEKVVKDKKEKIDFMLELFNISSEKEYKDSSVIIKLEKDIPKELKDELSKKIKEFTDYETKFEVKKDGLDDKERSREDGNTSK